MVIRQSIAIHAPADKVWDFVSDPERIMSWNPKLKKVQKISWGLIGLNYRYEALYELNNKKNTLICEIVQFDRPRYLKIECREKNMTDAIWQNRRVIEEYYLKEDSMKTYLQEIITVHDPRIPWWAVMLVSLIMKIGKPVGKTYLTRLKELVEAVS